MGVPKEGGGGNDWATCKVLVNLLRSRLTVKSITGFIFHWDCFKSINLRSWAPLRRRRGQDINK